MKIIFFSASIIAVLVVTVFLGCGTGGRFGGGIDTSSGPEITDEGVRFSFYSTKIERVCIAGDFNNWSMTADPLYDRERTGLWTILLPLSPGRYEYKFVVDGEKWIPDPGNPDSVDDGFGGKNSVLIFK